MPPPPAALLLDEMVEEILLRFPPEDPKLLLRAALVCKRWRRIVSDAGFRRRFSQLHRKPPMLGFLYNCSKASLFVPTCSFRPSSAAHRYGPVIDARHGRVLLLPGFPEWEERPLENAFVVWDPVTDQRRRLPLLPGSVRPAEWNAAVLCALCAAAPGGACDHLACCGEPFLFIFVATDSGRMFVYAYSSETGVWSEQTAAQHPASRPVTNVLKYLMPSVLVGNALHFVMVSWNAIARYDLGTHELSVIPMPPGYDCGHIVLMTTECGGLGFATVASDKLFLLSRECGSNGNARWVESRVIELGKLFPGDAFSSACLVTGFVEGLDICFMFVRRQLFTVDLKSFRVTKVSDDTWWSYSYIYPYMSFYAPAPALGTSTCEE